LGETVNANDLQLHPTPCMQEASANRFGPGARLDSGISERIAESHPAAGLHFLIAVGCALLPGIHSL
jgi:hypothetical protein